MAKIRIVIVAFFVILFNSILSHDVCSSGSKMISEENISGDYRDLIEGPPLSQISIRASGGRSPVEEYGITVKEYKTKIVIRSFEKWRKEGHGFDREAILSKAEYEDLWKQIEKANVWISEDSLDFSYTDLFAFEFTFSKNGRNHDVSAYGKLSDPLQATTLLVDELAKKKLNISPFSKNIKGNGPRRDSPGIQPTLP